MIFHQIKWTFQVCLLIVILNFYLVYECHGIGEEEKNSTSPDSSTFFLNMKSIIGLKESELVELGNRYVKKGKYDKAIQTFTEAINKNNRKASYYILRGNCYVAKKSDASASEDFAKAVELAMESGNPETLDVDMGSLSQIGKTLHHYDKYDKAVWCFTEIINKNESETEYYELRWQAYDRMGEYDKALLDCKKLLELETDASLRGDHRRNFIAELIKARRGEEALNETRRLSGNPNYSDELAWTCRQLWYNGENVLSIRCYDELINIVSNRATYYEERGTVYLELKDTDAAIMDFRRSLRLAPNIWSLWNKLLNSLVSAGKSYDVIMEDIQALDDDVVANLAKVFFHRSIWKDSVLFYSEAIRRNPSTALNFERRGRCYLNMNDVDAAIPDFWVVIRRDPDNALVRFKLKSLLLEAKKYKEVVDVAIVLNDQTEIVSICHKLFERNIWEEARRCFTEALKRNSHDAVCYEKRAICNLNLKKVEEVISDLKNAKKIRPLLGYLELHLCEALIDVRRYEEAAEILEYIDTSNNLEFTDSSLERISQARQIIAAVQDKPIVANSATVNA